MSRSINYASTVAVLFIAFLFGVRPASAQNPPIAPTATGTPPFGSYMGGPDIINLSNLNAHLDIPLYARPGRGGFNFTYDLTYDTSVWVPVVSGSTTVWRPVANWGWAGQTQVATGYVSYTLTQSPTCNFNGTYYGIQYNYSNWTYYDSLGAAHWFPGGTNVISPTGQYCSGSASSMTATASDGSGWAISATGSSLNSITSISGSVIHPPVNATGGAATATDRNGNQITVSSGGVFTDTLATTALTIAGAGTPASALTFTYAAPGGSVAPSVSYKTYTIQTNFQCPGITDPAATTANLVDRVNLADGSSYQFQYEQTAGSTTTYTGRLQSVTLPTGGTITYTYQVLSGPNGPSNGIICSDGSANNYSRQTPDGTWYFNRGGDGTTNQTVMSDPYGNQTVIQFQRLYETERQVCQGGCPAPYGSGGGTVLKTVHTCYNYVSPPCTTNAITLPIAQRTVTNVLSNNQQDQRGELYNSYGLLTYLLECDYGASPHGPCPRQTIINYASLGNIVSLPHTVTVCNNSGTSSACNGTGTPIAQTTYNYDENTPTPTSAKQHVAVSGSRGNLTSINYPVSGLTAHATYYDTGTVSTVTDVNGPASTTTYKYQDEASTCEYSFPTGVNEPLTLSRSMTWNCTGGVQLSTTDENGNVVQAAYTDKYVWRPSSVTDPTNAKTNVCYNLLNGGACPVNVSATQTESTLTFNSNASTADTLVTRDTLGRASLVQSRQAPGSSNFDSILQTFDYSGRLAHVTIPYQGTAGQTSGNAPASSFSYDALNRLKQSSDAGGGIATYVYTNNDVLVTISPVPTGENTKRRQLEYDALGRLTSVCEITNASGSGTCGQNSPQTGFWTKYTYDPLNNLTSVTQNAQSTPQNRSYTYDAMSRLTSESNPESGAISYTYDTDTYCGTTSSGDLVKRVDANGNTNCYSYDSLHRKTYIGHYGPNALYGHNYYVYDSAVINGQTMQNGKGRLVEAYTGSSGSKTTDLGVSYSTRGELTATYESTPHSGGYYQSALTYWANGAPNVLTGVGGYYASYNVDGEGRPYQVVPSSGQTMVTNTTYNVAGLPTGVTYGSGDSDSFTYDPSTNRMTQYKFTVGSSPQSVVGNLTWNANGTLSQLAITDPFNSANTQTCKYGDPSASPAVPGYDDLNRLVSANCGAAAAQTFSYNADGSGAFGNLTKSGSPYSFTPTYSSATNRMTNINGFTPSYDNNGNVLNDNSHTYSWDSEGRPATIDSVNITYDALGRMVEQNRSGVYTQFVYAPTGQKIQVMNGQATTKSLVPLPGGGQAVYTATGGQYYYHPDHLGSFRFASSSTRSMYFDLAHAPFGETYANSGSTDPAFTSQPQDTVAGLYDFPAREYSTQGRWPSPDPAGLAAVDRTNPQSWNRYAYVLNNPMGLIDPLGLSDCADAHEDCSGTFSGEGEGGVDILGAPCCIDLNSVLEPVSTTAIFETIGGGDLTFISVPNPLSPSFAPDTINVGNIVNGSWGPSNGSGRGNTGSSAAWQYTKVFVQGLGQNFVAEFKEGGCVNTFLNAFNEGGSSHIFNAVHLPDPPPGLGPDDILREGGKAAATLYAMNQALYVPLRSSIYRSILEGTETAAAYLIVGDLFVKTVEGAVAEGRAITSGTCH